MRYQGSQMSGVRAITFDLDDTLWEITPVIARAEHMVYEQIRNRFPRVCEKYALRDMSTIRQEVLETHSEIAHNLTEIRRAIFRTMLIRGGYDPEESQGLLDYFLEFRHDVTFFLDVIPALECLSKRFQLMTITNGNADIRRLGIAHFFEGHISAGTFGILKPDPRIFQHACQVLGHEPSSMLHVGDHPKDDVIGALEAGFQAVWINRRAEAWVAEREPDAEVKNLTELVNMLEERT